SIEFQAVFLQYLYAGRRDITVVPVLASFAHEALARRRRPTADARVARFLDALGETIATSGRRVALIAGADLAHMGPRFGDPRPIAKAERAGTGARVGRSWRRSNRGAARRSSTVSVVDGNGAATAGRWRISPALTASGGGGGGAVARGSQTGKESG